MGDRAVLRVQGEVASCLELSFADLAGLPGQIDDVGTRVPGREGGAVELRAVLERAGPLPAATHVTLVAGDGEFSASLPLEAVAEAVVAYHVGARALSAERGGPFRFFLPRAAECASAEADRCANVKGLSMIRLSAGPGRDTRPTTADAHVELHRREPGGHGRRGPG